jgi:hypothetical protein
VPIVDDLPLAQTPLWEAVEWIRQGRPTLAARLHHFYDEKLRPALRRWHAVREEEEVRKEVYNAQAQEHNALISVQQDTLRVERDAAIAPEQAMFRTLDLQIAEAHQEAGGRFAQAEGTYDMLNPSADGVLRHSPIPLEVVAAEMALPWTPDDAGWNNGRNLAPGRPAG